MPGTELTALEDAELDVVTGGQSVNTDTSLTRWSVTTIGRVPIPYRTTTTDKTRTPFGACVDGSGADCERRGGDSATVGQCKLDGVQQCWDKKLNEP